MKFNAFPSLPNTRMQTIRLFFNRLKDIRSRWTEKTPYEKFKAFYNIGVFTDKCLQLGVLTNFRIGFFGFVAAFDCIASLLLLIYTLYFNIRNNQFEKSIPCFCIFGLAVSVSIKFNCIVVLPAWKSFHSLIAI